MAGERTEVVLYTDSGFEGGAEVVLGGLATRLADSSPPEAVVIVGLEPSVVHRFTGQGVRGAVLVETGRLSWLKGLAAHRELFRQADVVHVSMRTVTACKMALLALWLTRRPTVIVHFQLPLFPCPTWRGRAVQSLLVRRADTMVAAGYVPAREVERHLCLSPGRVQAAPNVVADSGPVRCRTGERHPTLELVCLARFSRQKRLDVLVEAMALLPDQVRLTVIGDGVGLGQLERLVHVKGVADRVTFEVDEFQGDARRRLDEFDVFVLSSDYEGSPLVIVEAMLASMPVVATHVGGIAELVRNGSTGLVVPRRAPEALAAAVRALDRPEVRSEMGRAGRELALGEYVPGSRGDVLGRLHQTLLEDRHPCP